MSKIRITLTGHANTGKTTLSRCLTKSIIGKVEDRANVTLENMTVYHNGLQAEFVDTPGLQEAGKVLIIRKLISDDEKFESMLKEEKLNIELEVIRALQKTNIVYYIVSVGNVPDNSYKSEIDLIKLFCNRIIGVINKSNEISFNKDKLHNHIKQWCDFFNEENTDYIEYDFHWDSTQKQIELYTKTHELLNNEERIIFSEGIELLNKENADRRQEILKEINNSLEECNNLSRSTIVGHSGHESPEKVKNKLIEDTVNLINRFARKLAKVYSVQIDDYFSQKISLSTNVVEEVILVSKAAKKIEKTIENTTGGVGVGATVGAVSGGITLAQASIAGVALTGGLFLAPLAIFAGIGAIVGAISGVTSSQEPTKEVKYSIQNSDLFSITKILISVVWTIAYLGFEKNNITIDKTERIEYLVDCEIPKLFEEYDVNEKNYKEKIIEVLNYLGV